MRRREGLDYFPLDCHMDDSVRLIEAELGLSGFALLIKLWQEIYKSEGYYKKFDEDVQLLFAKEVNVPFDFLKEFLELAFKRGVFDRALFEKYEILTSKDIQERFKQCTKKRKENNLIEEYALICDEKGTQTEEKGAECAQSKVKESKVKESKVKESKKDAPAPDAADDEKISSCYGEYKNVYLTDAQREILLAELGKEAFSDYVKRIDEYMEETGKAYKDVYLTIKRWHRQDMERGRSPSAKVKKNKYFNYTDTNEKKYKEIGDEILRKMLEED